MAGKKTSMSDASGFTLIELIIVVLILGILAAIAIPNFMAFRDHSREAKVKSDCHTVQLTTESFSVDNDGVYPNDLTDTLPNGDTLLDLLPGGSLLKNAWTNQTTEPRDGHPANPGEIGFTSHLANGVPDGYTIEGYGKRAIVLTVSNGS